MNVALLHDERDGRGLHRHHVGEQVWRLIFGEGDERVALFGSGLAIYDQHGGGRVVGTVDIAERVLGADHSHNAEAGEVDTLPGTVVDLPAEHGFLAVDLDFTVGEARTGVDIGGAGFHIVAGQVAAGKASSKGNGSGRA